MFMPGITASVILAPAGEVLGPELITNGAFDTASDWTGWTITGGQATIAEAEDTLRQTGLSVFAETWYRLTLDVDPGSTFTSTGLPFHLRITGDPNQGFITTTGPQSFDILTDAGVGDPDLSFNTAATSGSTWSFEGAIDNISLKEIL